MHRRAAGSLAIAMMLAGCAAPSCLPMLSAQLLFGLTDTASFERFLDTEISPRFPAGLTVIDGAGRWRDPSGRMTREQSKVVLIVAEPGDATVGRLQAIRNAYKAQFSQQSVGLVLNRVCADF